MSRCAVRGPSTTFACIAAFGRLIVALVLFPAAGAAADPAYPPLPIDFTAPSDFARQTVDCCSQTVRVLGFWREGSGTTAPTISVIQERTAARTLHDYLRKMVLGPDQSDPEITFAKRCGAQIALLKSTGYRGTTPVVALQAMLLSGTRAITVSYVRPTFDAVDVATIRAVRSICVRS